MAKFKAGDKVVWNHKHGALHGEGSVLKRSAVEATAAQEGDDIAFGEVISVANEAQTWFGVALGGGETRTLTGDELVLVSHEE